MTNNDQLSWEEDGPFLERYERAEQEGIKLINKMNDDIIKLHEENGQQGVMTWQVGSGWFTPFALNNKTLTTITGLLPFASLKDEDYDLFETITQSNSDYDTFDIAMLCYAGTIYTNDKRYKVFDTQEEVLLYEEGMRAGIYDRKCYDKTTFSTLFYWPQENQIEFEFIRNLVANAADELLFPEDHKDEDDEETVGVA